MENIESSKSDLIITDSHQVDSFWNKIVPTFVSTFVSNFKEEDKVYLLRSFWLCLLIRFALLFVGYFVGRAVPKYNTDLLTFIYQLFEKWDARPFLYLAQYGYQHFGDERNFLAYFPLYPLLVSVFKRIFVTYMTSAIFVSSVCSIIAGYFIQKLASFDYDQKHVKKSLWFMMFFPTAYFMVVPYTESLFICLVLGSMVFAREKKWFLASLLAMFSTATRIQGLVMIPTLLIEFWEQRKEINLKKILYLAIVPLGFISYLGINYYISGNPLEFLKIQKEHYYHNNILPTTHIWNLLKNVWFDDRSDIKTMIHESRLIFIILTTGLLGFYIKKIRISYSFYSWSQIIILLTDSWLMSFPRYSLALFPLFFILADIAKKDEYYELLIAFSTICMVGFFSIYCTGAWAF